MKENKKNFANVRLVCMGDSLTEGYDIDMNVRWTNLVSQELDLEIINSGISGDTTAGMLARFQNMVIDHAPTHVMIMGGSNDISLNVSDNQILANMQAMTRMARYKGITNIIGIPTPFFIPEIYDERDRLVFSSATQFSNRLKQLQEKLNAYARHNEFEVIDFSHGMTANQFLNDGVHPNIEGQKHMAKVVQVRLVEILS